MHKDGEASLIIRERTDKVTNDVMKIVGYESDSYAAEILPSIERRFPPVSMIQETKVKEERFDAVDFRSEAEGVKTSQAKHQEHI